MAPKCKVKKHYSKCGDEPKQVKLGDSRKLHDLQFFDLLVPAPRSQSIVLLVLFEVTTLPLAARVISKTYAESYANVYLVSESLITSIATLRTMSAFSSARP